MTARVLIGAALRKLGAVSLGGQPAVDHMDIGLTALRELYQRWATRGTFGRLYMPLVTTTDLPNEAADLTVVRIADGMTPGTFLYDAWLNLWWDLGPAAILMDVDAPLEDRGTDGLAACLAEAMADELGAPVTAVTARAAQDYKNNLAWKFGFERPTIIGAYA